MMLRTILILAAMRILVGQPPDASLIIDGKLDDALWKNAGMRPFEPADPGVPEDLGGSFGVAWRGSWLCLSARLPEPGGKVLARAVGRNAIWQKDALGAPPVEDRLQYRITAGPHTLTLTVNPWGAYQFEGDDRIANRLLVAATVNSDAWTVEAALPLEGIQGPGTLVAERVRSRRALAPEYHWSERGNSEPPLRAGRARAIPSLDSKWNDEAWQRISAFALPRNEPFARDPRFGTQIKWLHDGSTLALLVKAEEPEPLVARTGGRDSNFAADDHLGIYLATSGSSFVEILVSTVGGVRDSLVAVGPHMSSAQSSWSAAVRAQTDIEYGAWFARIDIPLLEVASALGETKLPDNWRVVLKRFRAARPGDVAEISALPPIGTDTFYGPVRYRKLVLSEEPAPRSSLSAGSGLAAELRRLDAHVWPALHRRSHQVRTMVSAQQHKRAQRDVAAERNAWEAIATRADWERFRDLRLAKLRAAVRFPERRAPLDEHITARHSGKGYRLENLVFQSRPGFYVTANLYLPETQPSFPIPAIIILHSFHYPKTQGELHDMGELWARTGCAVLIPERMGFGERVETSPWYRLAYGSRFLLRQQLNLIGESFVGWMAWDASRAVDLLYQRASIDRNRIILMGAVAGGAEPAAVAAALDPRIGALVAYNYDHGRVRLDADFRGELPDQINMSLVVNSIAPRRYVHAFEFGWEGAAEPDFPEFWVSSWERSRKIWDLYGAGANLASAQGYGIIRLSMERVSHAWSIGPQHRVDLYPLLKRWFDIPFPSAADQGILPDSELSVNPYREQARTQEAQRRRPLADLVSVPPSLAAKLPRKALHQIAYEMASADLGGARKNRDKDRLRAALEDKLGTTKVASNPRAAGFGTRAVADARVEAFALAVEEGISVPVLLLKTDGASRPPVVVAIAQQGKARFLASRSTEIERLLRAGIAVCLPDLRGTGETAPEPDWQNLGRNLSETEYALGGTLAGARVRDLRAVIAWLRAHEGVDSRRIALWGDSFAPPNSPNLLLDEIEQETGPEIQYHSEPQGCNAVLFAGLLENDIHAVACRGGLGSYLSILQDAYAYVPADAIVPGILQAADVVDIAAAYAPRPLLLEGLVNGRNVRFKSAELQSRMAAASDAYAQAQAKDKLTLRAQPDDIAAWLIAELKR
jgi:cephalosporin-C deacetylase-like acetyl esterase